MPFIPNTDNQRKEMLAAIGLNSMDQLFADIPSHLAIKGLKLPEGLSENEAYDKLHELSHRNGHNLISFLGGGFYDHIIPSCIDAITSRTEFLTAYTPYQPEASQGTLQTIFEYQSSICRLTRMDVSNASMYDGGTALYEGVMMALRATGRKKVVADIGVSPIYRKMLHTYTPNLGIQIFEADTTNGATDRAKLLSAIDDQTGALVLQNPNFFGTIDDFTDIIAKAHEKGCLVVMSVYPISLGILKTPGEMGADIATGEGQSLGNPLSFGGPYLGFITAKKDHIRRIPGRIVGLTVDQHGKEGFVLTLQAREQHIRREKATSNICSNEALCAARAVMFMALAGKNGLREMAEINLKKAEYAKMRLTQIKGVKVWNGGPTFNEFVLSLPRNASEVTNDLIEKGFAAGFPLYRYYKGIDNCLLVTVTEKRSREQIGMLAEAMEAVL